MKNIIVFSLLFLSTKTWSQEDQKTIAKFIITEASINDVDVSETAIESKEYLVFYTVEGEIETYLANYWVTTDRQTYGKVYDMEINKFEEDTDTYAREEFTFSWRYAYGDNPDKKYTAKVNLTKIFKKNGITFVMTIVDADLDVLVYKGFMEGSFNY